MIYDAALTAHKTKSVAAYSQTEVVHAIGDSLKHAPRRTTPNNADADEN